MRPVYPGEGGRYELVIRLIKITNVAAEGPRKVPDRISSRDRPRHSRDSFRDRNGRGAEGWRREASPKSIPRGCFMRAFRSSTARDYSSRSAWTRADREQTSSLAAAVSWINVIALAGLLGHHRLLVHFSSTKPARFNRLSCRRSVSEVIKSRHAAEPLAEFY